jgi:glutathione S-transferase
MPGASRRRSKRAGDAARLSYAAGMQIYHREYAGRPLRVVWTLEELGCPYELEVMTYEQGTSEEHLARHPLGRVPVIDDGEGNLFESAAICMQIADLHPEAGLIPPPGTHERGLVYQWSCFAPGELEPPLIEAAIFADAQPERAAQARKRFGATADAVAKSLDGDEYLVGGRFTVADVLVSTALGFTSRAGFGDELAPTLKDYVARLTERPAYKAAMKRTTELPASK